MSKVTVIGAGNVGATCANAIAHMKICSELVLLDIKEGLSEGKAIDMMQTAKMYGFDTRIKGVTNDYAATRNSNVIVVTSGIPRKPGMTREVPVLYTIFFRFAMKKLKYFLIHRISG